MNEPNLDAIAAKIEKLLALASSPNEHEAKLAAEKAQELLEAYNLDMVTIEQRTKKGPEKREDTKMTGGLYQWQRDLWKETAELNFCKYWSIRGLTKGSKYEHRLLGRSTNVLSTRLLAEYLQETVERLARAEYANDPRHYFSKAAIAYREGMAARITEKLRSRRWEVRQKAKEEAEAQQASADAERALTILDVERAENDANEDYINEWEPGTCARMRAEQTAYYAKLREEWEAQAKKEQEEEEAFKRDHPEEWAAREARREKARIAEEKKARRRKGRAYKAWEPRHAAYYDGYDKGDSVSIDRQIGQTERKKLT